MSDDETPFDEDELRDAGLVEEDSLTPEEVFSLVMINKKRNIKTSVELRDAQNNVVALPEVIESLIDYINGKIKSEEQNQFVDQIFPMMGQALVSGLGRLLGNGMTGFYLANDTSRHSFIFMMCISFLLLKYVQDKKLTIVTIEEPTTADEIESVTRKSKANSMAIMGSAMGMSYKEIMQELVNRGELTEADLQDMLKGTKKDDTSN
jgi:hypothetical protein